VQVLALSSVVVRGGGGARAAVCALCEMASMTNARLVLSWPLLLVGNERKATAREIQASLLRGCFSGVTTGTSQAGGKTTGPHQNSYQNCHMWPEGVICQVFHT
jgi:hypothetical protein